MPLAFESVSHGTIAFGFFNIESDMLLLDRYFFFATDFCEAICKMAKEQGGTMSEFSFPAFVIKNPADVGDLHGGIAATHYSGFIGESYKKYPFPKDENGFKQQTEGFKTRDEFVQMILKFGTSTDLLFCQNNKKAQSSIGPYVFSQQNYLRLVEYVIQGGYPGWLDDIAPDYVVKMKQLYRREFYVSRQLLCPVRIRGFLKK